MFQSNSAYTEASRWAFETLPTQLSALQGAPSMSLVHYLNQGGEGLEF
jgi:hypothetical protein